jgi:hypothetical protein
VQLALIEAAGVLDGLPGARAPPEWDAADCRSAAGRGNMSVKPRAWGLRGCAMFKRFAIPAAAFGLMAARPAASSAATITEILGGPSTYDGQDVDVRGTVERLEQKVSHKGP